MPVATICRSSNFQILLTRLRERERERRISLSLPPSLPPSLPLCLLYFRWLHRRGRFCGQRRGAGSIPGLALGPRTPPSAQGTRFAAVAERGQSPALCARGRARAAIPRRRGSRSPAGRRPSTAPRAAAGCRTAASSDAAPNAAASVCGAHDRAPRRPRGPDPEPRGFGGRAASAV